MQVIDLQSFVWYCQCTVWICHSVPRYCFDLNSHHLWTAPDFSPCKTKRSLKFDTPNAKPAKDLNTSNLEPLESPEKQSGSVVLLNDEFKRSEKRLRSDEDFSNWSGWDDQDEDFPTLSNILIFFQKSFFLFLHSVSIYLKAISGRYDQNDFWIL